MSEELGEIRIIEIFRKHFKSVPHIYIGITSPTGIYEDAGAIRLGGGRLLVVTTDMIGKKTHIPPKMSLYQMGRKAVVVNVSDLAAMGAKPLGLVFSIGISKETTLEQIEKIAEGMNEAAQEYETCIFGGDVNLTDDIILAGTAIGLAQDQNILLRSGAKVNDIVAVTGVLGGAALGLSLLKQGIEVEEAILKRITEPKARLKEALALMRSGAVTAAGDITDGLALELHKIGEASKVGIEIQEAALPLQANVLQIAEQFALDPLELVFYVGEDFELLLTIAPDKWDLAKKICQDLKVNLTQIGRVIKEKNVYIQKKSGQILPLEKRGYDQFNTLT
ncbi:MAG: thiamine-phosphate kinase [Candidatus Helarchaeota archaeon]